MCLCNESITYFKYDTKEGFNENITSLCNIKQKDVYVI